MANYRGKPRTFRAGATTDTDYQWEPTGGAPIRELSGWDRAVEALRAHTIRGPR